MINRERMTYIYLVFLAAWFIFVFVCVRYLGITVMEGIGLGTASGVFLSAFKDMWQFLWRRASPEEQAKGNKVG